MPGTTSRSDLEVVLYEAEVAARRLVRQLRLPRVDLDDVRQDLLVDLLTRLPAFDAERGALGAFAGLVVRNHATRIAAKVRRQQRIFGTSPMSLDDPAPGCDGASLSEAVSEEQGLWSCLGQPTDSFAEAERRFDVERALGTLEHGDRNLCAALSMQSVDRAASCGVGARSSLYRRVREIRLALLARGVQAA
ncbi:MAG: sigma factor [Alphaproteobacteria bacterium]